VPTAKVPRRQRRSRRTADFSVACGHGLVSFGASSGLSDLEAQLTGRCRGCTRCCAKSVRACRRWPQPANLHVASEKSQGGRHSRHSVIATNPVRRTKDKNIGLIAEYLTNLGIECARLVVHDVERSQWRRSTACATDTPTLVFPQPPAARATQRRNHGGPLLSVAKASGSDRVDRARSP